MNHDRLQKYTLRNLCHNWPKALEIGPYGDSIRFDVVDVNRRDRGVKIFEIKTSRSDFLGDNKWEKYLDYCDYLAFVCPEDIIKPEELPEKVGLVYVKRTGEDDIWGIEHNIIKRSYKLREEKNLEGYIKVLEAIASRRAND